MWPFVLSLPLVAIIAVLAVILLGSNGGGGSPEEDGRASQGATEESAGRPARTTGGESVGGEAGLDHPALGDAGAPVVMVEYADYQ